MYVMGNLDTGKLKVGGRKSNLGKVVEVEFRGSMVIVRRLGRADKWYAKQHARHMRSFVDNLLTDLANRSEGK
jgi:hypothetical protein